MNPGALLQELPLRIESCRLEPLETITRSGWKRCTTVVRLSGLGEEGLGEDVTYDAADQHRFQARGRDLRPAGRYTLEEFSRALGALDLFTIEPLYRRWAFESAALDLALRQAGRSLASVLGREPRPVRYVVSLDLGSPPGVGSLRRVLERHPGARFKVDLSSEWDGRVVKDLARTGAVDIVDLKGHYRGDFKGPPADPEQYRAVAEGLRDVWIEDPELNDRTRAILEPHRNRITWDAILHSAEDLMALPFEPSCVNMKPSRFGFLAEITRAYAHCESRGIGMYGGGQFEIGPGRGQIQYLASLFHPDAPNDVAPAGFNEADPPADLSPSPLRPAPAPAGFAWGGTRG